MEATGRAGRFAYRALAILFDFGFALPLFVFALGLVAISRQELLGMASVNVGGNALVLCIGAYHGLLSRRVRFRSPGELIVGYSRTKSVANPFDRSRWLLFPSVFFVLFIAGGENRIHINQFVSLAGEIVPQSESVFDIPAGAIVQTVIFLPLLLLAAVRVAMGRRGWLIAAIIYSALDLAMELYSSSVAPAITSGLGVALLLPTYFLYRLPARE